jgi:hypothetical protein
MPKKEREIAREDIRGNIPKVEADIGAITGEAKSQLPGAKEDLAASRGAATGAATGLGTDPMLSRFTSGEANPFATSLATTGGISPDEAQAMETAATRGVRSVYDVMGAEAQRKRAITGGYGGGGEFAQIARQSGQKQAEAITDARARIAGLRQGGRIAGSEQVGDLMKTGAGLTSQERVVGAQLLTQQYGISQDQSNAVMDMILKATATGAQLTQNDIAMMVELSKQKGTFGAVAEGVGQVGGAVGGILTGVGGLGGGKP